MTGTRTALKASFIIPEAEGAWVRSESVVII